MTRTLDEIRRELLANTHYACAQRLLEEAYEAGRCLELKEKEPPPPAEAAELKPCPICGEDVDLTVTTSTTDLHADEACCNRCQFECRPDEWNHLSQPAAPSLPGVVTDALEMAKHFARTNYQYERMEDALQALRSQGEAAISAEEMAATELPPRDDACEPAPEDEGDEGPQTTHWETCWKDPKHWRCAVARVERLQARVKELEAALRSQGEAAPHVWTAEDVEAAKEAAKKYDRLFQEPAPDHIADTGKMVPAPEDEGDEGPVTLKERGQWANRVLGLERERDEARERAKELEEERDRLLSGMAQQSNDVRALIEAAVADRLDWDENCNGRPQCEHCQQTQQTLYDATEPFLPAPQPSRVELLEKEHEVAKDVVKALRITTDAGVTHFEQYEAAHRAVESAERGEGE